MQETGADLLLTDLCAICHMNPIKYTCPRCGIHTCSLSCVKRHKTWAQCSGIRDPTTYRKRADLATPASVDQDFNFITSVERSLQQADDRALDQGINLAPSGTKRQGHGAKRRFEREVEDRGVRLVKAPQGLSRNKQNKSHCVGQHNSIMWTTEWYHEEDKRVHNVTEQRTVGEAFVMVFGRKNIERKKRKRSDAETRPAPATIPDAPTVISDDPNQKNGEQTVSLPEAGPEPGSSDAEPVIDQAPNSEATSSQGLQTSPLWQDLHFYLLRPNTISKLKCLIPISPASTLADVLRDKTILEFPTFYVRQETPDALPEPFVTEEKYNELYGSAIPIQLPTYDPINKADEGMAPAMQDIDEKKVLEVLQKDLDG